MKIIQAKTIHLKEIREISKVFDIGENKLYTLDKLKKLLTMNNGYIAIENKKIIGAMILIFAGGNCKVEMLVSLKKGTGRKLIEFALNKCRAKNIPKIWCWSMTRYDAIGFYQKMGFEEVYLLKKQWFGEDCYILGKLV